MFFYCTTKIKNYYKLGIANSWSNIKGRVSNYRSTNPKTNIKFFTEIPHDSIERTFKSKFSRFRIGRSECYKLRSDIIYKHLLKFLHTSKKLHCFWNLSTLFVSEYYIDGYIPDETYDFKEKTSFFRNQKGFIPIATYHVMRDKNHKYITNKKGEHKYLATYVKINKSQNLRAFYLKYKNFLEKKYWGKRNQDKNYEQFIEENFKAKKFFYQKNDEFEHPALWAYHLEKVKEMIFDSIKKSSSGLIKNYANTPQLRNKYPYHNNYRSITNVNSMSLLKNIKNKFKETRDKYEIREIIRDQLKILSWQDPLDLLHLLQDLVSSLDCFDTKIRGSETYNRLGTALEHQKKEMIILRELKKKIHEHQDKLGNDLNQSIEKYKNINNDKTNIINLKKNEK